MLSVCFLVDLKLNIVINSDFGKLFEPRIVEVVVKIEWYDTFSCITLSWVESMSWIESPMYIDISYIYVEDTEGVYKTHNSTI